MDAVMTTTEAFPQMPVPNWMSQFSDPAAWQNWMKPPEGADATAGAAAMAPVMRMLGEAGAMLSPAKLEALRNDYLQKAGKLWQDFMSGQTPSIHDKRFSASAWSANPMTALSAASYLLNSEFLLAMADTIE